MRTPYGRGSDAVPTAPYGRGSDAVQPLPLVAAPIGQSRDRRERLPAIKFAIF